RLKMFLHPIKMRKLSFYISKDHIKSILFELGKFKFIEFLNLNHQLRQDDLPFAKELLWLERKRSALDVFITELEENDIDISPLSDIITDLNEIVIIENRDEIKDCTFFEDMDDHFTRLQELKAMRDHINSRLQELKENLNILSLLNEQDLTKKSCMTGIIDSSKLNVLKKILETVFRNNLLFISSNYEDSTVFLIFTHGNDAYEKLIQICTSFGARLFSEQSEEGNTILINTEQKQKEESGNDKSESKEEESNEKSEFEYKYKGVKGDE
ncbi:H+- or Na+-translocating F-type, V-type and A-type ATPase (F-ATPase) Superfamily, partial [Pseudoloma neurophilia]